jgi:hypothetical protein
MSVTSTLLLAASLSTAGAASDTDVQKEGNRWTSVPLYVQARGSLAVPARTNGDVASGGLSIGILTSDTQSFGMRFIYMDDPPANPLGQNIEIPFAWGPVVDWTYTVNPDQRASMFTTLSAGYVYGVPEDETANNVILPILEGGVGLRFSRRTDDGKVLYIAPEIGFVPGAVAPMSAINLGMILPGGKSRGADSSGPWGDAQ